MTGKIESAFDPGSNQSTGARIKKFSLKVHIKDIDSCLHFFYIVPLMKMKI